MGLLGDNVTTVEQASSHVLAVARVTLDHLVVGLEARHGDLVDRVGFVSSLVGGDDGGVGNQREVDTGVGDQVGLELVQVDIERTIETQGSGDGGDNLGNQAVQVLVAGALDSEVTAADVVDGLVVNHEAAVGVLQGGVGGQDGVVGLHDGGSVLRGGVNAEFQLGLLAVVNGETLHQESTETRTGTTTEGVENQETLETSTVVGNTADLVEDLVDHLLSDSVVTTGVVVGGILTTGDHVLGVEKAAVGTGTDLIDDIGLEVTVDGTGDIFALACCRPTQTSSECTSFRFLSSHSNHFNVPVSEKKVLKPVSGSAFLRSSVKYPSGCYHKWSVSHIKFPSVIQGGGTPATTPTYLNAVLETVEL